MLAHHYVQLLKSPLIPAGCCILRCCSCSPCGRTYSCCKGLCLVPACFLWVLMLTFSELFLSWTYLPSRSISSMLILPVAEACWDIWKLLLLLLPLILPVPIPLVPLPESSSASIRFLLPREERVSEVLLLLLLEVARETVTREEGLGESFNLNTTKKTFELTHPKNHKATISSSNQTVMWSKADSILTLYVKRTAYMRRRGLPISEECSRSMTTWHGKQCYWKQHRSLNPSLQYSYYLTHYSWAPWFKTIEYKHLSKKMI